MASHFVCFQKNLTSVEQRSSQTEREALTIVWACERFSLYVYVGKFLLETDHKPLQYIYAPRSKPSARVERWVLRLQAFNFDVIYRPGRMNIADSLSHPTQLWSTRISEQHNHSCSSNVILSTDMPLGDHKKKSHHLRPVIPMFHWI